MNIEMNSPRQIGVGLAIFGVAYLFLGMVLFCDAALLTLGNILFIVGIVMAIGWRKSMPFFFERSKKRGSLLFFGGIAICLYGYPFIGIPIEAWGFIILFGGLMKYLVSMFLPELPYIGWIMSYFSPSSSSTPPEIDSKES